MAKRKATKATKRASAVHKPVHTDDHSFLIIAGGGFVIVAIIMLFFSSSNPFSNDTQANVEVSAEDTMSVNIVSLKDSAFTPETKTINVGTTVTFQNDDVTDHSVVADDESFATDTIAPGEKGTYTFTEAGTYSYHCALHPDMTGTIVVE